jgi:hypothetical protein
MIRQLREAAMQLSNHSCFAGKPTDKSDDPRGPRRGAIPTPKKIIEDTL